MAKVVLLTGGSKGIGYATAKSFAERGCKTYEISRHEAENPGVTHITGDVTDQPSVEAAVKTVIEREGRIDVLLCNAGTILSGAVEFLETEEIHRLMELNLFGVINCVRAVLPHMRAAKSGRIAVISSMAAVFPVPYHTYYSVSKAAVSAFAFALANEVRDFGISVCAVLPGDTNSDQVRIKAHDGDELYGGRIGRSVAVMERDEKNGMKPDKVGSRISAIALKKRVKPYYAVGFMSKLETFVNHLVPSAFVRRIVRLMYAK
jgi:NAD(P)-dependent dehydrogenase (short-subunit alcohol dehydrogenase family)